MEIVIYKIVNLVNGKVYIGSASYYNKRRGTHIGLLRQNKHKNPHLQSAWNKYKEKNFEFSIIEKVSKREDLLKREQYWLDKSKCYNRKYGYNIAKIAGSNLGNKISEEAKKKIGDYWRGKPKPKEQIEKYKKVQTEINGKVVLVYDKNGTFIKEYPSLSECSREIGITVGAISNFLSRKLQGRFTKRRGKYIFKYKDIV